ncbi:hypothetical protein PENTCL1PPCAC_1115, partial [Pristionchus entomophagus]
EVRDQRSISRLLSAAKQISFQLASLSSQNRSSIRNELLVVEAEVDGVGERARDVEGAQQSQTGRSLKVVPREGHLE